MEENNKSDALTKRKKNADAQAAFRARRHSYIRKLECVVLRLRDAVTQMQNICKSAVTEAKECRERCAVLERGGGELTTRLEQQGPPDAGSRTHPTCNHAIPCESCFQPPLDFDDWTAQTDRMIAPPPTQPDSTTGLPEPEVQPDHAGPHASSFTTLDHVVPSSTSRAVAPVRGQNEAGRFAGAPFEFAALGILVQPGGAFHPGVNGDMPIGLQVMGGHALLDPNSTFDVSGFTPRLWTHPTTDGYPSHNSSPQTFAGTEGSHYHDLAAHVAVPTSQPHQPHPPPPGIEVANDIQSVTHSNKRSWSVAESQNNPDVASIHAYGIEEPLLNTQRATNPHVHPHSDHTIVSKENASNEILPITQLMIPHIRQATDRRRKPRSDRLAISDPIAACSASGSSKVNGLPAKVARCQNALIEVQDILSRAKEEAYQVLQRPPDVPPPAKRQRAPAATRHA